MKTPRQDHIDKRLVELRQQKDQLQFEQIEMMIRHDQGNRRLEFAFFFFIAIYTVLNAVLLCMGK